MPQNLLRCSAIFLAIGAVPAMALDFSHQIVPILRQHCGECHTGKEKKGGFSMNTRAELLHGSENGAMLQPGKSTGSRFLELITSTDPDEQMPPKGARVSPEHVALLRQWIEGGLPWQDGFTFGDPVYEPPLKPRNPALPPALEGRENPIDRILDAYLAKHKQPRPAPLTEAAFLRRVYQDVTGLLPTPEELAAFEKDPDTQKRAKLISYLLENRVNYADHWLTFWNDLLRNDYTGTGFITGGRKQITAWLYRALLENMPYDRFVRELVAPSPESEGFAAGIKWRGDVNASQTIDVQFSQNISQVFLGINMKCASCHDSFIDRWKLTEAYNLAAIYATTPLEIHRCDKPTGQVAQAAWIFPELGQIDAAAPQPQRLQQLAGLMTHPQNGRFTRTLVNRVWDRLMGRGIVHPVDAMHTEPWSEDLLDWLASDFAAQGYDLKKLIRGIVTSQAYQSRAVTLAEEPDPAAYIFQGPIAKRLTAEQLVDAIWQMTGTNPPRPDAQVTRVQATAAEIAEETVHGQWIWSYAEASSGVPKPGEKITLRGTVTLPANPVRGDLVITCDNEYKLFVNGKKIGEDTQWETVEAYTLDPLLKKGKNQIMVVAGNAGNSPNAAALFVEGRVQVEGAAEPVVFATDGSWEWTASILADRGGFGETPPKDWKPAAVVANQKFLPVDMNRPIREGLLQAKTRDRFPVRAALVNNDFLMRSLGRPHREQVVTTRPADLTTLQAIDLSNGEILADTLRRGAVNLLAKDWENPEALIQWLYRFALSRSPSAEELTLAREITGPTLNAEGVEDLLWTALMLPEFQLVR